MSTLPPWKNFCGRPWQGRIEVRWRPGKEVSLAPLYMFEPEVFRKQCSVLKKVLVYIVGTFFRPPQSFRALRSDSAPGELCPLSPRRYAPGPW